MRLLTLLDKDLKLLFKDTRSIILVFLTPIIIMGILASVFDSKGDPENLIMGVCIGEGELPFNLSSPLLQTEILQDCEKAKQDIREGRLIAAVIIPEDFTERIKQGFGSTIELYYDNAQSTVANLLVTGMRAEVQGISNALGSDFIFLAWSNLKELNAKLKTVSTQLARLTPQIQEARLHMVQAEERLKNLDTEEIELQIGEQGERIQDAAVIIDGELLIMEERLDYILYQMRQSTINTSNQTQELESAFNEYCTGNLTALCEKVNLTTIQIEDAQALMDNTYREMLGTLFLLKDSVNQSRDAIQTLQNISSIQTYLDEFEDIRMSALQNITGVKMRIDDALALFVTFQENLNTTTQVLDWYTSIDPENVVRPVALTEIPVFPRTTNLKVMAPALLLVILMFLTLLLSTTHMVQEKNSGTMVRMLLAPVSMTLYFFQKLFFQLLLALIGTAGMLIVLLWFGITFPASYEFIVVIIVASISFISLGFILGAVAKTETTGILAGLVLGLPMMFLSGAFIPLILLGKTVQDVSLLLPLTQLVLQLQRLSIYGQEISAEILSYIILGSTALLIIAMIVFRRQLQR
ncbi:MAG: ABC transporter permease [Nanoarchaeota archaeon]